MEKFQLSALEELCQEKMVKKKLDNGAELIQIYSGLIFKGHKLIYELCREIDSIESKPYLFSYRRCPYAMRARMALVESNIEFDIYEISLRNKPNEMLTISSKGTVPVSKIK